MIISISLFVLFVAMGGIGYALGYFRGWTIGVDETEKRWSDTATKADWICRYGDPSTLNGRKT